MNENREKLRVGVLQEGKYYLHAGLLNVRHIDRIDGKNVYWTDRFGSGRCTKETFIRNCIYEATRIEIEELGPNFADERSCFPESLLQERFPDGFTMRDEANALTAFAFRNGFLEDLHSGIHSDLLDQPSFSRITDLEMKELMIEASRKLAALLAMREQDPEAYRRLIQGYNILYCRAWER